MKDKNMVTCICGICGSQADLLFRKHWAFKAPATFDIYDCANCETRFVSPMEVDTSVYDLIYEHAAKVPGYDRYERYRQHLKTVQNPLNYLASQEDVYWSISEILRQLDAQQVGKLRILEVGSGLGYLTYALQRAGYDCCGIDISTRAVEVAKRDFGDFYSVMDLMEMPIKGNDAFDLIIATELIEHVTVPKALIEKAQSLLKPDGKLIMTTPNKDLYSERFIWHTDPPPVHLWWFSKTSMRRIAWGLGMSVKFVDFSKFYGFHNKGILGPTKPQTFDENGKVKFKDTALNTFARALIVSIPSIFKIISKVFIGAKVIGRMRNVLYRDSLSLCIIMQNAGTATEFSENMDVGVQKHCAGSISYT